MRIRENGLPVNESDATRHDWDDFMAELRRMDAWVCSRANALRCSMASEEAEFRGVFISEAEFDELLARPFGCSRLNLRREALAPSHIPGAESRWRRLIRVFGLSPFEADVLLLGLLPEIDLKYERIYAYLQDDVTQKRPSIDLALSLLCLDLSERVTAQRVFLPEAPLLASRLLSVAPPGEQRVSRLSQSLCVESRVVAYLLDLEPSPRARAVNAADDAERALESLTLPPDLEAPVRALMQAAPTQGLWLRLSGEDEWTAIGCAGALCKAWGLPLTTIDLTSQTDRRELRETARVALRDALLDHAALLIKASQPARQMDTASASPRAELDVWIDELAQHPLPVLWLSDEEAGSLARARSAGHLAHLAFPRPDYGRRLSLWRQALSGLSIAGDLDLEDLANRYRLNAGQIDEAAEAAYHHAWQRRLPSCMEPRAPSPGAPVIRFEDLSWAARALSSSRLGQLARQIEPRHDWDDLILPKDRLAQLREICDQYKYRYRVYDEWGFGRKASLGRGLSALFAGPSGTGKTMASEVMAAELALDLYKIDLSGVVSKYIGETEKNLERIFALARDSNAILLFDEADALFGKRSETKDAQDRYANIEVSYLLQKIEEYDGVVILTSNLRQNLDEAFLRRLQFTVEFPLPDEEARLRIWQQTWPEAAPRDPDVDLRQLARRFRLSGGSIRNILVNAAFLAAREDGRDAGVSTITTQHLLWAARREFQKLGKLVDESLFPELDVSSTPRGRVG